MHFALRVLERVVETHHLLVGDFHRAYYRPDGSYGQDVLAFRIDGDDDRTLRDAAGAVYVLAAFGVVSDRTARCARSAPRAMFAKPREVYVRCVTANNEGLKVRRRARAREVRRARSRRALRTAQRGAAARHRRAHPVVLAVRRRDARHARRQLGPVGVELCRPRRDSVSARRASRSASSCRATWPKPSPSCRAMAQLVVGAVDDCVGDFCGVAILYLRAVRHLSAHADGAARVQRRPQHVRRHRLSERQRRRRPSEHRGEDAEHRRQRRATHRAERARTGRRRRCRDGSWPKTTSAAVAAAPPTNAITPSVRPASSPPMPTSAQRERGQREQLLALTRRQREHDERRQRRRRARHRLAHANDALLVELPAARATPAWRRRSPPSSRRRGRARPARAWCRR